MDKHAVWSLYVCTVHTVLCEYHAVIAGCVCVSSPHSAQCPQTAFLFLFLFLALISPPQKFLLPIQLASSRGPSPMVAPIERLFHFCLPPRIAPVSALSASVFMHTSFPEQSTVAYVFRFAISVQDNNFFFKRIDTSPPVFIHKNV